MKISRRLQFGRMVTPIPDRSRPVYRWFQMEESFSSQLVLTLCDLWGLGSGSLVVDPFCGAGTTLLACKERGIQSVGFDVHPLCLFVSRAKTRNYDVTGLEDRVRQILEAEDKPAEVPPEWTERYFPPGLLRDILSLRGEIERLEGNERMFLLLGLVRAAIACSWAEVDGAVLKVRRRRVGPFRQVLSRILLGMLEDLRSLKTEPVEPRVEECDARRMSLPEGSVDAAITSPPYLFKTEYIRAHRLEEWLLGLKPGQPETFFGGSSDPEAYFSDMREFAGELARILRPGALSCIVAADGCSRHGVVRIADRMCEIAGQAGFSVKKVLLVNERWCTTPSRRKLGRAGEYIFIWERR